MISLTLIQALHRLKNVKEDEIYFTNHFLAQNEKRHENPQICVKAILKQKAVGIFKQDYNKFKICYEHYKKSNKDLYIVLSIKRDRILLITTYDGPISRRRGLDEKKESNVSL